MASTQKNHGGARNGAGRKSRDVEIDLDALMTEALPRERRVDIIRVIAARANSGDVGAARLILEYAYGKPSQRLDVTSNGERVGVVGYEVVMPAGAADGERPGGADGGPEDTA